MTALRRSLVALTALLVVGESLHGQTVRGSVVNPDSSTVAGAIVVVRDDRGATVGQVLTSASGLFSYKLPAAGRYSLQVLRIGYRPTPGPAITVAADATESVRIVLSGQAVVLTAINVRDRGTCRVGADSGLAVARVWEEVRKAMLSSSLQADRAPLVAEWIEYDRHLDSSARIVRGQNVRTTRSPTTHAFKSVPAEQLDSAGYVVTENGMTTYHAPDANVLLSEVFAASHCFRLEAPPRAAPTLLGVNFEPTGDRRDRRDIHGTAWLDRSSAELRWIEFRYTNLNDVAEQAGAG
ncbi:MAG TPA: carboxypeptidase-like regulatory domain-containing protein, partial [Gemmatimonadaceae bacterium]